MKKKLIADIRLYKSDAEHDCISFADKKLNAAVHRVVMVLREQGFSLGDFDHLYLNFTVNPTAGSIALSEEVDRYHPWYRYCTVSVEQAFFDRLPEDHALVLQWIGAVLASHFASEDFDGPRILDCVRQAAEQGEGMLMQYKEKVSATRRAVIFLRYLDSARYAPLLRVYDLEDRLLFEHDLPQAVTLDHLGELQVRAKRVAVKPRKNAFTGGKKPLVFEY